jgi:acetyl-CoA carboxylase biotin carboxyl carrier protein
MALSADDVREILRIIDESDLDELRIDTEGFSLHVRKGPPAGGDTLSGSRAAQSLPDRASVPAGEPQPPAAEATQQRDGLISIPSPMLGTFYRSEAPGTAPFVEVGAHVGPDSTVCIIEVMKMMNSVPAGVSGVVAEIVPENGQLVEYGEELFRVRVGGTD